MYVNCQNKNKFLTKQYFATFEAFTSSFLCVCVCVCVCVSRNLGWWQDNIKYQIYHENDICTTRIFVDAISLLSMRNCYL